MKVGHNCFANQRNPTDKAHIDQEEEKEEEDEKTNSVLYSISFLGMVEILCTWKIPFIRITGAYFQGNLQTGAMFGAMYIV